MVYNRIPITFGPLRKITGPPINYQYDVTQVLVISGIDLPEYYVVDFCNEGDTTVIPITGTDDGVEIPDELLQTGKPIKAYIVVAGGEGDVQTRYEIKIPVNTRPQRDDIHPTPAEQQQIDALVAAMNNAVDRSEASATDAAESATAAQGYAENASGYAAAAAESARSAGGYAESAANSADDAGRYAGAASGYATRAESAAGSAAGSAQTATEKATAAATSAQTATEEANRAKGYAESISGAVEQATAKAGEAAASATAAGQSATSAGQSASAAASSATSASGSATSASNSASTATTKAGIATTKAGEAAASASTASEAAATAQAVLESIPEDYSELSDAVNDPVTGLPGKAPVIVNNASGAVASFSDGADGMPVKMVAQIANSQSGWTGTDIYDDPVYGRTINWNQLRRNTSTSNTSEGVTTSYDSETHLVSITNVSRTSKYTSGSTQIILASVNVITGHKYALLGPRETGVSVSSASGASIYATNSVGYILTANTNVNSFRLRITSAYDFVTAHPIGNTYSFPLNIVDITQLLGEEAAATATYDQIASLFPKDWYSYNSGEITCVSAVNGDPYRKLSITFSDPTTGDPITVYGGTLTLNGDGSADLTTDDDPSVNYHLVDVGNLLTIRGNNNIWCDISDSIDIDYAADTKLYIDGNAEEAENNLESVAGSIAPVEATSTASQAYAVGDLLMYNNQLYKVAGAIASGETLTPGTNIVLDTVSNELSEISVFQPVATANDVGKTLVVDTVDTTAGKVSAYRLDNPNFFSYRESLLRLLFPYTVSGSSALDLNHNSLKVRSGQTSGTYVTYILTNKNGVRVRSGSFSASNFTDDDFVKIPAYFGTNFSVKLIPRSVLNTTATLAARWIIGLKHTDETVALTTFSVNEASIDLTSYIAAGDEIALVFQTNSVQANSQRDVYMDAEITVSN